ITLEPKPPTRTGSRCTDGSAETLSSWAHCHSEVPMSETRIWITGVFNDPHQAERYADCLGALQQADQSRHAQLNRKLGLKPLLAGELGDVFVDSIHLFGAGVEVWLTTPPGADPQAAHFRDLHRLGCQLAICETFDDQDASTALAVYIAGRKASRKAILEVL